MTTIQRPRLVILLECNGTKEQRSYCTVEAGMRDRDEVLLSAPRTMKAL